MRNTNEIPLILQTEGISRHAEGPAVAARLRVGETQGVAGENRESTNESKPPVQTALQQGSLSPGYPTARCTMGVQGK